MNISSVSGSSIDDFFDLDGNPNFPIEVSDFENMAENENSYNNHQSKSTDNILVYDSDFNENVGSENIGSVQVIDESSEEEEIHILKRKKTLQRIETWKRNCSKKDRALGLEHTSIHGKLVMSRSLGPDCKCRNKCFTKVNNSERDMILGNFNKIGNKEKQDKYIVGLIKLQAINRKRPRKNSKP